MFFRRLYTKVKPKQLQNVSRGPTIRQPIQEFIANFVESKPVSKIKWNELKNAILENDNYKKNYPEKILDSIILRYFVSCKKLELAGDFLKHVQNEEPVYNLAFEGNHLRLLYYQNEEQTNETDEMLILSKFAKLRETYPVLDSYTLENCILALSVTREWQKCFDLIEEFKSTSSISMPMFNAVASAALRNHENEIAFKFMREVLNSSEMKPGELVYRSYLKQLADNKNKFVEGIEALFQFLKEFCVRCPENSVREIIEACRKHKIPAEMVNVPFTAAICKACRHKLEKFDITEEEFLQLKTDLMSKVLVGQDVFRKTNPTELQNFKEFIKNMKKFDVVLDGLNIAYSTGMNQPQKVYATLLASVVAYFVEQKKSVLVLGRVHMHRWSKPEWRYIRENASLFLTQNISQDDPYLLYCALNSGKDTIVVSRDLMRQHKFRLDYEKRRIFDRWLSEHQYVLLTVSNERRPIFGTPPPFSAIAQKNSSCWHVPYISENTDDNVRYQKTWLCVDLR